MFTALMNLLILAGVVAGAFLLCYECFQLWQFLFARGRARRFLAWLANVEVESAKHPGK